MLAKRLARWPLYIAALFFTATIVGYFFLPTLDPGWTLAGHSVAHNSDLVVVGLAGLVLIFGALSFLLRKPAGDFVGKAGQDVTMKIIKEPKVKAPKASKGNFSFPSQVSSPATGSTTSFGAAAAPSDPKATKAAQVEARQVAALEKKRALETAKFAKAAEKDAATAARQAAKAAKRGRGRAAATEVDELSSTDIVAKIVDSQHFDGTPVEETPTPDRVVYEIEAYAEETIPVADEPTLATAAAALDVVHVDTDDTATEQPSWLDAAYSDPTFAIPFAPVFATTIEEVEDAALDEMSAEGDEVAVEGAVNADDAEAEADEVAVDAEAGAEEVAVDEEPIGVEDAEPAADVTDVTPAPVTAQERLAGLYAEILVEADTRAEERFQVYVAAHAVEVEALRAQVAALVEDAQAALAEIEAAKPRGRRRH